MASQKLYWLACWLIEQLVSDSILGKSKAILHIIPFSLSFLLKSMRKHALGHTARIEIKLKLKS